jgi:hypothetical protein
VNLFKEINETSSFIKCENQYKPIQRKIISQDDNSHQNKRSLIKVNIHLKLKSINSI